jgi:hypothetical protein
MACPEYGQVRRLHPALLIIAAIPLWLVLGFDGRLHWDEPHYLYAGAHLSIEQIVAGDFQPSFIPGFTTSRIAHVVLVNWLAGLVGIGTQLVGAVMALYAAMLLICFYVIYIVLRELAVPAAGAAIATVTVMFSPIGLYLSWKTLPDVPALMWSSLAVLAAVRLIGDGRPWVWFPVGVLALAMAALTKQVLVWTFVSFAAAAIIAKPVGVARARLLRILIVLSGASFAAFAAVLAIGGLNLLDFLKFIVVASQAAEPLAAKALNTSVALGLLWILLPIAAFHHDRSLTRFFWVWFAIATLPFLVITPRLEIRYLTPALIPLAGLVFLSFDLLARRLFVPAARRRSTMLALMVFMAVLGLSSRWVQGLTGHEVEVDSMHTLFRRLDDRFGRGMYAVTTPWEYSTFLYMRVAYPDRAVYDAFDPQRVGNPNWSSAQERFFPGRILRDVDQLRAIDKQLLYIGFPEAMPISNLRRMAGWAPMTIAEPLMQKLDSLDTLKHLSLSWMWNHPELSFTLIDQVGNYHVYQVTLPETPWAPHPQRASGSSSPVSPRAIRRIQLLAQGRRPLANRRAVVKLVPERTLNAGRSAL